jgi:rsbT antagonist protein RsbS
MTAKTLSRHGVQATSGCLVVTLPADLDTEVVGELHVLLDDISRHRSRGLVIDLSLVNILPSKVATLLVQLASAARLLHSPTVICGINPGLAAALALFGIEFEGVPKARDMDHALAMLTTVRSVNETGRRGVNHLSKNSRLRR